MNALTDLFPKARAEILRLLFAGGNQEIHLRDLARLAALSPAALQKELTSLAAKEFVLTLIKDTFRATVNCAVIVTQRGPAPAEHTCQMADLTNVSIHDQYERFLHLLYQTEGTGQMSRRQNISNQTYALYHYRQSLIATNSNIPCRRV